MGENAYAEISVNRGTDEPAVDSLVYGFEHLVLENPLPVALKHNILEAHLGSGTLVHEILARIEATGHHVSGWYRGSQRDLAPDEVILVRLTEIAAASGSPLPAEKLQQIKAVAGRRFAAWADLLAFAAQARIVMQCHLGGEAS